MLRPTATQIEAMTDGNYVLSEPLLKTYTRIYFERLNSGILLVKPLDDDHKTLMRISDVGQETWSDHQALAWLGYKLNKPPEYTKQ